MSLLTISDVQTWVPQAEERTAQIADAIAMAEAAAAHYCGRTLELTSYTEVLDVPPYTATLTVPQWPLMIDDAHTLTVTESPDNSPTVVASGDYAVDADHGFLRRTEGGYWAAGYRAVQVAYHAGYTSATLPPGLKRALLQLVAWIMESAGNVGATQESRDGYSVTYEELDNGVPKSIGAALRPYRRMTVL